MTNDSWDCGSEYFASGTGDGYKNEVAFGNVTRNRMHQDDRDIQFLSTEWHVQK